MSWLKKIADHNWWDLNDPFLTLYHATSESSIPKIKTEGLKPLDIEDTINRIVTKAGLNPQDVPREVFKEELYFRRLTDTMYVHWGSTLDMAKGYSTYVGQGGGEFAYNIQKALALWASNNGVQINPIVRDKTVVVKADIPRELIYYSKGRPATEALKDIYSRLMKAGYQHEISKALSGHEFLTGHIPPQYITDIIEVPQQTTLEWLNDKPK